MTYRIKDWDARYENNRTRDLKHMAWVPVPNSQDGDGYTELVCRKNGPQLFGAWIVILQVASKCNPRGTLVRDNGIPHDAASISRMTRFPVDLVQETLKLLASEAVDWLECDETPMNTQIPHPPAGLSHPPAGIPHPTAQEGKEGTEQKEGRECGASPLPESFEGIVVAWNLMAKTAGLPVALELTAKRTALLKARLSNPTFNANWPKAIERISSSDFCKGSNDRGWRATLDWFLKPDSLIQILEGKYDRSDRQITGKPNPRNDGVYKPVVTTNDFLAAQKRRQERDERQRMANQALEAASASPSPALNGEGG